MSAAVEVITPRESCREAARRFSAAKLREGYEPKDLHPWRDADGTVRYFVIRLKHPDTGEKWVRPMHLNEAGEYILEKPEAPEAGRLLYNLPAVLAADPETPAFIVEGEGKVDALATLGILATTSGSCSSADGADWTPLHRFHDVRQWPDNDAPGMKYAAAVVAKLHALGCTVRLVSDAVVQALREGGDVVDWLREHPNATAADILALPTVEAPGPEAEEMGDETEATFNHLANLSPTEYDRCREKEAKTLGIRVGTLDKEVEKRRPSEEAEGAGRAVQFDEPEPWPEPVDGAALLNEIAGTIRRFIVMPDESAHAAALWVVHAWAFNAARVSPVLAVTSPEKRCGKTTLLEVLSSLTPRSLPAANITAPVIFRAVEKYEPTLLIDEADTFLRNSDELRGVLNSGHRRRSAYTLRNVGVGDDYEPRQFRTWAPKAIALIGKLPPTLADRSINAALRRRGPGEAIERWRDESFPELRRKLTRFAADNETDLSEARPTLPDGLHDRALDNWEPLFAIADAAGSDWPTRARAAAAKLSGDEDESAPTMLLADIRGLFEMLGADRVASVNLCEHLVTMEARPWPEWGHAQKPITPRQVARLLKPFGIVPGSKRIGGRTPKGYDRDQFTEAFTRYLPADLSATPPQPAQDGTFSGFPSATLTGPVADGKTPKPAQDGVCGGVADENTASPEADEVSGFEMVEFDL